jgi:hypothetical protein
VLGDVTAISTVFGSAPPADADISRLRGFVRAACDAGLWLLLIEPGDKQPVDMRSAVQKRQEDAAAREAARASGQPNWERAKSKGGVYLSSNDPDMLIKYMVRYRKQYGEDTPINFGIDVGRSKLIVVDCDTASQVQAFLSDFEAPADLSPTVVTPGQVDADGTWAHKDGGHFYFTVDSPLPDYSGSLTAPGGYVLLWANRYVLIPPSVRPEGVYRLAGQDLPAPTRLTNMVHKAIGDRMARRTEGVANSELATAVDQWAAGVAWEDILAPAGWTLTARTDNCGCDIWTAPGDHGSPKSATAHDVECTLGRYTVENAPLHIWTDYPGPELEAWMAQHGKTLSRLQVVAALDYGGSVGDAMRKMSLVPDASAELGFGSTGDISRDLGISEVNLDEPSVVLDPPGEESPPDPFDSPRGESGDEPAPGVTPETPQEAPITGVPEIQPFDYWRDFPPPEFAIEGLLEHRGFASLIGAPGVGKSGVALDMAAAICLGRNWMGRRTLRQPVLYLPGEGLSGAVQRIKAWEDAHDLDLGTDLLFADSVIQVGASSEAWAAVIKKVLYYRVGLIIIDTFARAAVGLEENSATDVGKAVARFDWVRRQTGAGLLVVHHSRKDGLSARGSSALHGALDTELLVRDGLWWDDYADDGEMAPGRVLEMVVTKQKNAAQPDHALPLLAVGHGNSFVMTGPSGIVDDPLDAVVAPRALIPESVVSIAIRIQEFAQRFAAQGLTRQEAAYGVAPDDHTAHRRDAKTAWRMRVNEAIDLGLRYMLIQTLTGTATGARYIPGPTTPQAAMDMWSKEVA